MKVLVSGSRKVTQIQGEYAQRILTELYTASGKCWNRLIEGAATGIDWYAARWAEYYGSMDGIEHLAVPAKWSIYGRKAGMVRNQYMIDMAPSLVVAFPCGVSKGTRHCIATAQSRGIDVRIYELDSI
jgi:hypothetical protein